MKSIKVKTPKGIRKIGPGEPVFIVAEMSGNHNQSFERAKELIDRACEAGVDAIKLQTYTPDTLTIDSNKDWFRIKKGNSWSGQTLYELYKTAYTPWEWQAKLKERAEKQGVMVFSTPFDDTAVDFLEKIKVSLYKVASFEIGDHELLKKIGSTKKPVIISRGMAPIEEIKEALNVLKKAGSPQVAVLHCVSAYPSKPEDMNLSTIPDIVKKFKVVSGLSDHTLGLTSAIASVSLGASIIEKHFTLKRVDGGPDAAFSLEPQELKDLVQSVREAEKALGKPSYKVQKAESQNIVFRRSLFIVEDVKKGETFTRKNVRSIRPGYGMAPKHLSKILGKKAKKDLSRGTPLKSEFVAN